MIERQALLKDLQSLLKHLEDDLRERHDEMPEVAAALRAEFDNATANERTAWSYEDWLSDRATQVAAAWVLSCVFARFLEDNRLVDPPQIAGPGDRLKRARDEYEAYFREPGNASKTDRDYLLHVFAQLAALPGARYIFAEHNLIHHLPNWLGPDAAGELLKFFQHIDANSGALSHDFTDGNWDTRFLGDLYQDLSEAARKKYALLQTPDFVEAFILDRTLEPALDEFGLDAPAVRDRAGDEITSRGFRMIDPACGSGHFLLGAFHRILDRWQRAEPATSVQELVQNTLNSIHGVDINPFAVAIARFRLLLAAVQACGTTTLAGARPFELNLACGDSLFHGRQQQLHLDDEWHDAAHYFRTEDAASLCRILKECTFHCVVANPPYITPKDRAANGAYRRLYSSCHMKYSLAAPFMERIFRLAVRASEATRAAGFTGQITANSFMKREFGKKLIEEFLPTIDLSHVIDTSGAFIPGHATPTIILFGRNRRPVRATLRAAMGVRGEPATPDDPSRGLVWSAIEAQLDHAESETDFVSVVDVTREQFHKHPWSIGGGGAAELKEWFDSQSNTTLSSIVESIGPASFAGVDDAFVADVGTLRRFNVSSALIRPFAGGDQLRDWRAETEEECLTPYGPDGEPLKFDVAASWGRRLWPMRRVLESVTSFGGKSRQQLGEDWWTWYRWIKERVCASPRAAFAFVATHNHFVIDRATVAFNRSAPIVKYRSDATDDDHFATLGLLNSSAACFWMKQVMQPKQMTAGDGVRIESIAKVPHEFAATQMGNLPLPPNWDTHELRLRTAELAREANDIAKQIMATSSANAVAASLCSAQKVRESIRSHRAKRDTLISRLVLLQEELDFTVYAAYGLARSEVLSGSTAGDGARVGPGDRPFCMLSQLNQEGFSVPKSIPSEWPANLRVLWERRIDAIKSSKELQVIEDPHYKRRWGKYNHAKKADESDVACEAWLRARLESIVDFDGRMCDARTPTSSVELGLISVARLASAASADEPFMDVASAYRDDPAFDVHQLVNELVTGESVPLLPVLRYKPAGLRKRAEWEQSWHLQRLEDRLRAGEDAELAEFGLTAQQCEAVAAWLNDTPPEQRADSRELDRALSIPIPPKYKSSDFISTGGARYWALRGKLDVPKERWISFPHCEGEDGTLMICWAGCDHLQQARAISEFYVHVQEHLGGRDDRRLIPLLACLIELLPWLKQWHNDIDPEYQMRMGDYFEGFVNDEARQMGKTIDEIKAWEPPKKTRNKATRRKRVAT